MTQSHSQDTHYFAYGSNLHPVRLEERVGPVKLAGVVTLSRFRLRFNKCGSDGSGKGNIERTSSAAASVFGCLYTLTREQRSLLDEYESLGNGYERLTVQVTNGARMVRAFTYRAMPEFVDDGLHPFDWYLQLVRLGARHHNLPANYRQHLDDHPHITDPDRQRAESHAKLITRITVSMPSTGVAGF